MYNPINPDGEPLSSFQFPVDVPSIDPLDGTMMEVQLPEEYFPLILGCLQQLLQPTTWDTTDPTALGTAITRCDELIYLFLLRFPVIPPGTILAFGSDTVPAGWLRCDGSAISRTGFADLFSAIGTGYGVGDGSTTFNLPEFRGRAIVGSGQSTGTSVWAIGDTAGEETVTLTEAELPAHTHTDSGHIHTTHSHLSGLAVSPGELPVSLPNLLPENSGVGNAANQNTGSGDAHDNLQPFGVAMWMIKT